MNDASARFDDHSLHPVPASERASGLSLALITFGIGTTLPVFWLGAEVTQAIGFQRALLVFLGVCLAFGLLSVLTGMVGNRSRLSTYMVLHFSFGRHGAKLINLGIAVTLVGFYGATVDAFGAAVHGALLHLLGPHAAPAAVCALLGSGLMTLAAVFGLRGLEKLSNGAVPLMVIFIGYLLLRAVRGASPGQIMDFVGHGGSVSAATASVIGMVVMMPVLMPDVTRYAHGDRGSLIASLGLTLGFPFVFLAGGLPSIITGQLGIAENMAAFGVVLPALFILVFSNWITNTANLYSATLTLATVARLPDWKLTLAASLAGTALALSGCMAYFQDFIFGLSVFIPPIASIYLVDFFLLRRQRYVLDELRQQPAWGWPALLAWCLASLVAYLGAYAGWQFSSFPTLDALVTSALSYPLLHRVLRGSPAHALDHETR